MLACQVEDFLSLSGQLVAATGRTGVDRTGFGLQPAVANHSEKHLIQGVRRDCAAMALQPLEDLIGVNRVFGGIVQDPHFAKAQPQFPHLRWAFTPVFL